jgi:hypothetical protein
VGRFKGLGDIPAETAESKAMSKGLKQRVPVRRSHRLLRVHADMRLGQLLRSIVLPIQGADADSRSSTVISNSLTASNPSTAVTIEN